MINVATIGADSSGNHQPTSLDWMNANDEDVDPIAATGGRTAAVAAERPQYENMCSGLSTLSICYNVLVHAIMYGYTAYLSWISFVNKDPYSIFCWHSPLSLLGVSILVEVEIGNSRSHKNSLNE